MRGYNGPLTLETSRMARSLARQLLDAAEAFDLGKVERLVKRGAQNEHAFLSDQGATLTQTTQVYQFLADQGRQASTKSEALFELYETLLLAGHPIPDGVTRHCVTRVVYGAGPDRFERVDRLATIVESQGMLNWETSAYVQQLKEEEKNNRDDWWSGAAMGPARNPHQLLGDAMAGAATHGNLPLLTRMIGTYLTEKDSDFLRSVFRYSTSPMFRALANGHIWCAEALLDVLPEKEWRTLGMHSTEATTALDIASRNGQSAVVDWLTENGLADTPYPGTLIAKTLEDKNPAMALKLIAAGYDVNAVKKNDPHPLHLAIFRAFDSAIYEDLFQPLLDAGAPIEVRDADGKTPLIAAGMIGVSPAGIQTLVQAGADLQAVDMKGKNALHWACKNNRLETAKALDALGVSWETQDEAGLTPLEVATKETKAYFTCRGLDEALPSDTSPRRSPRM